MNANDIHSSQRQCTRCGKWVEETSFPKGRARCVDCNREDHRRSLKKSVWKHKYNITPEMYRQMYEDQGGECVFCGEWKPLERQGKQEALAVDHDHDTNFVRGLLCRPCNARFIDEYLHLPKERQDYPLANDYLTRGKSSAYMEDVRRRAEGNN